MFDVNLRGVVHGIQAAYPLMIRQGFGHIVNTASAAGLVPGAGQASYTASKHAVIGLSKVLRIEAARHNIRVSALCPGVVRTPMLSGGAYGRLTVSGIDEQRIEQFWEKLHPMDPDAFARQALDAVAKNRAIIILPKGWNLLWYLERVSPRLSMWFGTRAYADMLKQMPPLQTGSAL